MKVLIWFLCIFANALITTLIKEAGVILGGIPTALMFAATLWLARTLCKKWDEHKENKAAEKNASIQKRQAGIGHKGDIPNNGTPSIPSGWQCSCGRVHPKYESSCVCGKSKTDNLNHAPAEGARAENDTTSDRILFCRKCGEKLIDDSRFCSKCGAEVVKK